MSLLYIGGETAQIKMALPAAVTGVFQGMLLFYLLGADLFIRFRLRWMRKPRVESQPVAATPTP
jgi:simple sugar transport system permease protein